MNKRAYRVSSIAIDESLIIKHHSEATEAFNRSSLEVAKYPCISCTKFCYLRKVTEICAIKNPIEGKAWEQFLEHYESNPVVDDGLPDGYLCDYCMKKICADVLSAWCILNRLCARRNCPTQSI